MANATEIGLFLSGGSTNVNVNKSTGGAISTTQINQRTYNNLWSDISERQIRYGWKTMRIIYLKNLSSTETFKNARVYWRESDTYTTIQIGRAGVNATENSTLSVASILPTSEELPPSLWNTAVAAADTFTIVQDFNNTDREFGNFFGGSDPDAKMGVGINDSSAAVYNQKITRMTFLLKRMGTARGNVNCKIWSNSGQVKATLGSVDSNTLNEAGQSPPEPFSKIAFTNTSNNYACQTGDVIGLEYPGGGQDEDSGSDNESILLGNWAWDGANEQGNPDNVQYDIEGTSEYRWREVDGFWKELNLGRSETIYRAEVNGSSSTNPPPLPTDPNPIPLPTNPDGSCTPLPPDSGPGEQPTQPLEGFLIIQDFNDLLATTGYSVGGGDGLRRAVKVDNTTATILSNPIARMTFLLRRVGNPSGTVWCKIWNSSGTVMQTLGGIPVTNIGNQANQWSQVPFTLQDNAYQMKVGDLVGIEFTSGTASDHVVIAGWQWRSAGAAAAAAEAGLPEATAVSDSNGVKMIYPNSGSFDYDWEIPGNSNSMRWDNVNPPLNAEMTGYFFKSSPSSDTISCKIRGGRHTDSAPKDGCCYIPQFPCTGGTMQFEIECPHPNNHDCSISGTAGTSLSMGTWHGYKCIWWNDSSGCVHIEAWQDKGNASGSTPPNQWEKLFSHIDCSGNCGEIDNPLTKPKGSTSQCTFRIDNNSGTQGKWLSVVQITPGGVQQPGDPNQPPPTDPNIPPDPNNPPPSGAHDVPGTSIARWTGTAPWIADDGGLSDLVYRAERYSIDPEKEEEEKIIIDPGTKRKPVTYDQGIVLPPLGPGDYKAIILEQMFFPSPQVGLRDIEQSLVVEVDATTSPADPTDPGLPPATAGVCPPGQYYDSIQGVCVQEAGSPGSTADGIILPSLPTTSYSYDTINYTEVSDHRANGSFREYFEKTNKDLNNVLIGGYIQCDGPDDEEITAKLGGGFHSTSDGGKAGRCYNIHIRLGGNSVAITKEDSHSIYHDTGINRTVSLGARQTHYTGVMFMKVNVLILGQECVRLICWVDTAGMSDVGTFTSGNQNWIKVLDEIDNGNWHGKPWLTGAVAGNSIATIRTDQQIESTYDAKFLFSSRIIGPLTSL